MKRKSVLLVLGLVALVPMLLAAVSPAFAATKAKTYLPSSVSVDAVTSRGTATLTYAKSGRRVGVSKQYVKVYRRLSRRHKWASRPKVKTASNGRFTVTLPAGYEYKLAYAGDRKRKPTSATLKVKYVRSVTFVKAVDFIYMEDTASTTVVGVLNHGSSSGSPVKGATLTISKKQLDGTYAEPTTTVTTADGWEVAGLTAGDYRVTYPGDSKRRNCSGDFTIANTGAATDLTAGEDWYLVEDGATTAAVSGEIQTDLGTLGTEDEMWTPMGGAALTIYRTSDEAVIMNVTSDAAGLWSADLPLGDYAVRYDADPDFIASDGLHYSTDPSEFVFSVTDAAPLPSVDPEIEGAEEYTLGAGRTTVRAAGRLVFHKTPGDAGTPMAGVVLSVAHFDDEGELQSGEPVTTDSDGYWSAVLAEGDYFVSCDAMPEYLASDGNRYRVEETGFLIMVLPAE